MNGVAVTPAVADEIGGEVLGGGDHSLLLNAAHEGCCHLPGQTGILTVGLLSAAAARITGNIDGRAEELADAARPRLDRNG